MIGVTIKNFEASLSKKNVKPLFIFLTKRTTPGIIYKRESNLNKKGNREEYLLRSQGIILGVGL